MRDNIDYYQHQQILKELRKLNRTSRKMLKIVKKIRKHGGLVGEKSDQETVVEGFKLETPDEPPADT